MKYDLVFEGGGAKGMAFVGAYQAFVGRGHTVGRLLGTSAGAITAALIAAGYTPQEMRDALQERENDQPVFAGFMGPPAPFDADELQRGALRALLEDIDLKFIPNRLEERLDDAIVRSLAKSERLRNVVALIERGGWYGAERFVSWMTTKLDSGPWKKGARHFGSMTLAQFHAETEVFLSLVAADTSAGRLLVLNHRTAPDCPLVWAVRMSMSIPLLWNEVIWDASWGAYLGRSLGGHSIVDGGMLSNFPIELFISDEPQVTRLMGPKQQNHPLGLLIDESLPVPPLADTRSGLVEIKVRPQELRTVQRLMRLIDTATGAHDKMVIDEFRHLVIRLPAHGYGTTEFDMSDERRRALVAAGERATNAFFDRSPAAKAAPRGGAAMAPGGGIADRLAMRVLDLDSE